MQIADEFLRNAKLYGTGAPAAASARPLVIEPWIASPPDVVVYEFGARLDANCQAAAAEQIHKARRLYNAVIECIRTVHGEMNAWVLERAGRQAQILQAQLSACEQEIASAKAATEVERLHMLAPRRIALGTELTALLRTAREKHRAQIRSLFFARVGNTTTTETYRLRCQAVDDGLGWATATEVLDSALQAWKKSLALGRAPKLTDGERKHQDALILQFTVKGGLPVERVLDGSRQEIHLSAPDAARKRAYGAFRFRLGLARDGADATGTWQYHRPLPEGAHVSSARLVRRRVADKDRWGLQLVLRLAEPIRLPHTPAVDLAAMHFSWIKSAQGRRVATIARSADPAAAQTIVLPASIEGDLARCAELQGKRAMSRNALMPRLATLLGDKHELPTAVLTELTALGVLAPNHVAAARIYRLHKALAEVGLWRDWLDAWVREDRMHWQAAVLLARRARGRRRDFYRRMALQIARDHGAVVMEPLDLCAASKAVNESSGQWRTFSRHARAGRVVASLHEFEQAIRWACARHDTPVFELKGMTARSCAACGAIGLATARKQFHGRSKDSSSPRVNGSPQGGGPGDAQGASQRVFCVQCGAEHDRHANAAGCAWRWTHEGLEERLQAYRVRSAVQIQQTKALVEARKTAVAEKRRASRATAAIAPEELEEPGC